ncbi:MAG: carbohydrate kinase family protein [Nanoarchaeota archaeon]|nr:carbohydrate kinase family protein [Nanoarchaeota archaeon]
MNKKHPHIIDAGSYDVITIGSATIDIFANSDSELITIKNKHGEEELLAYPLGSKILIKKIDFQIGGGGTNTAVSFARLGFKTGYMGCLGDDLRGNQVVDLLKKEKIDFVGHFEKAKTNLSIVLDSIENDRTILVYKDASDKLKFSKLGLKKYKAKLVYSSSMINNGFNTIVNVSKWCKKNKILFAFNPSSYQAQKGIKFLQPLLKNCSILILNKEEAGLLVGHGTDDYLLTTLAMHGPQIIAITDGKKGASLLYKNKIYHTKPKNVKVAETTGAGDAFASGLVGGLLLKEDPIFALKMAMIQAESVIQHYGAKNDLLRKEKMLKMIAKDRRKITQHHVK